MGIEFKNYTVGEFNKEFKTSLTITNDLDSMCGHLEKNNIGVFYADGVKESVIETLEEEKEVANSLPLKHVYVNGYYMAIY
jgi:hypothetical protein